MEAGQHQNPSEGSVVQGLVPAHGAPKGGHAHKGLCYRYADRSHLEPFRTTRSLGASCPSACPP